MKKDSVEVSSDQLKAELIAIKERLGALETIASISNRQVVEVYVREHLKTDKGKQIMKECAEPRTREYLMKKFGFNSAPALDYHLNPLREADLLRQRFDDDGTTQTFEQSNLFKRLPKSTVKKILDDGQTEEKQKTALPGKATARN
jgi:DNA-binding transcriptional ArsR family regulator